MFEDKSNGGRNRFFIPEDENINGLDDEMMQNYVPEPEPYREKKDKKPKSYIGVMILIVVVGLIILVGAVFVLTEIFTSPYKIYTKTIDSSFSYVKDYLKLLDGKRLDYDPSVDALNNKGNLKIDTNMAEVMHLGEYSYDYELNWNGSKEEFRGNLGIKQNDKTLLDWKIFLKDDNVYTKLDNIFDRPIQLMKSDNLAKLMGNKIDYNDILNILEVFKDYIGDNIEKNNVSHDKGTFKIDNLTIKVNRNNYVLTKEMVQKKYKGFLEALLGDNNAMTSLASIMNKDKKEVSDIIKKWISDKEIIDNLQKMKVVIYTKGLINTVVGFSVFYGENEIISFGVLDKVKELKINFRNLNFNLVNKNDVNNIILKNGKTEILRGKISLAGDKYDVSLASDFGGLNLNIEGNIERKKIGGKRQTLKLALEANYSYNNANNKFKLELDNITQIGRDAGEIDLSSAIKIEDLGNNDIVQINNNLHNTFGDSLLDNLIRNLLDNLKVQALELKCQKATDCACVDDICVCKYVDDEGVVEQVTCSNNS